LETYGMIHPGDLGVGPVSPSGGADWSGIAVDNDRSRLGEFTDIQVRHVAGLPAADIIGGPR
jgi:hypothetical protein